MREMLHLCTHGVFTRLARFADKNDCIWVQYMQNMFNAHLFYAFFFNAPYPFYVSS